LTRLVIVTPPDFGPLQLLRDRGVQFFAEDNVELLRPALADAEAMMSAPRSASLLREILPHAKSLRWLHTLSAGVETLPFDELLGRDIVVTNSRRIYAEALGEYGIAAMLWFAKDLRRLVDNQSARRWEPFTVERLDGKSVGIIGYGGIGRAIGRRAEALGMRILPVSRREGDIDAVIPESDYIALTTPLTHTTRGLMSAARIAKMRTSAVLINVSRGAVADEAALVDALRNRRIRGAALDVFETEPLPPDHPFWTLDNVLLSPHSADRTADGHDIAMRFFLENLGRFERGEPLENIVDKAEQY
jgi:phosphoglycerate dehydrogenase-like enzyme